MKRLSKDNLRELRIFNPHDIARISGQKIVIVYNPSSYRRISHSASWQVYGMRLKTDPGGPWYDNEQKTFEVWRREDKAPKLAEAIKWAEKYGIKEWEKDPFGGYQVKGALELAINKQLSEMKKGVEDGDTDR